MTSNLHGHAYGGPDKEAAIAKLKRHYSSMKMDFASKSDTEEMDMTQVNKGNTSQAKKLLKVPVDVKDRFDDESVLEEQTDEQPSAVDTEGEIPVNPRKKGLIKSNSKAKKQDDESAEDMPDDEEAEGETPTKKKSAVDNAFAKMKSKMQALMAQGVSGPEAMKMVQEEFNNVGKAVEVELSGVSNDGQLASALNGLATELSAVRRENAEIKAMLTGKSQVQQSADGLLVPKSKAITMRNGMHPQDLMLKSSPFPDEKNGRKLSQIEALARKSTGLDK